MGEISDNGLPNLHGKTAELTHPEKVKGALDAFVENGQIPGYNCLISHNGEELMYLEQGKMDAEANKPVRRDTLFRIYSMTKPLTSVAMMQLYEKGLFDLGDPVSDYIPEWENLQVFQDGDSEEYTVSPPDRQMTILDLLTHTSGFTYDFMQSHPVDALYRQNQITGESLHVSLQEKVRIMAKLPLQFSPGTQWNYSVSTDAIGYLVQLLSGKPLNEYVRESITGPLGMPDTGFSVSDDQLDRFAACYQVDPNSGTFLLQDAPNSSRFRQLPAFISGGGGMVSTIDDYHNFCLALLQKGSLNERQLLEPSTVDLMTRNHLPGNRDLAAMGQPVFTETPLDHVGFGLGFAVTLDGQKAEIPANTGEFSWGGLASTYFWIDPVDSLIVIFMTQVIPSDALPIRKRLRESVYAT